MTCRRAVAVGWTVVVLMLWTLAARAQPKSIPPVKWPVRQAMLAREKKTNDLIISFSYRDVVDSGVRKKLQSGLPTVINLAATVFRSGSDKTPIPQSGLWQSCRVAFDVWNEVYRIRISRPSGDKRSVAINLEGVLRRCAEVRARPLQGRLQTGLAYYVVATVEVNPISQEMLEQIRRWVSRPPGTSAGAPGDSLFGSFVGLFVARIGKADRTLWFRTQTFTVPK